MSLARIVVVNILVTSSIMVSWQMFYSISLANNCHTTDEPINEGYHETTSLSRNKEPTLLNSSTAAMQVVQEAKEVASRWKKYRDLYNHKSPDRFFMGASPMCGVGPEYRKYFALDYKQRSRLEEDAIIYNSFFKGRFKGTGAYVELGAFDGKTEANTRFFDICLGWKGLLIEGNPETYKKTVANRPLAHRMSFAPSCQEEGTIEFYKYPMANSGLIGMAKEYEGKPTVEVPCGPLGPVLEDLYQGQTINFFSLDVEGSEPTVLETIDFDRVKIDVLMIEVENYHCIDLCESRLLTRAIMEGAGYKRYNFGSMVNASDVYVHPRSSFNLTNLPSYS